MDKKLPNLDYAEIDRKLTEISKKTPKGPVKQAAKILLLDKVTEQGAGAAEEVPSQEAPKMEEPVKAEESPKAEEPKVEATVEATVEAPTHGKKTTINLAVTFANGIEFKLANKLKIKFEKLIQKALKDNPDFEYSVNIDETFARTPKKGGSFINFKRLA